MLDLVRKALQSLPFDLSLTGVSSWLNRTSSLNSRKEVLRTNRSKVVSPPPAPLSSSLSLDSDAKHSANKKGIIHNAAIEETNTLQSPPDYLVRLLVHLRLHQIQVMMLLHNYRRDHGFSLEAKTHTVFAKATDHLRASLAWLTQSIIAAPGRSTESGSKLCNVNLTAPVHASRSWTGFPVMPIQDAVLMLTLVSRLLCLHSLNRNILSVGRLQFILCDTLHATWPLDSLIGHINGKFSGQTLSLEEKNDPDDITTIATDLANCLFNLANETQSTCEILADKCPQGLHNCESTERKLSNSITKLSLMLIKIISKFKEPPKLCTLGISQEHLLGNLRLALLTVSKMMQLIKQYKDS
ncbi:unnamed protein product [Protopolystoma xenopodis]|uniref:Uncharacterized protein n=1 Tax=Protopolystoma xenopodis TaxID=117903 RepID=A0A448XFE0_9PLAT|nr:unnamed protein product [Protopolystoma xenopodis]